MTTINEPTESVYDQALAQREAGDIHGAIRTLTAAAQESLTDVTLVVTLGQMLTETDQTERAGLRHAMKLAPDDLYACMVFGTFLGMMGRPAEARDLLGEVREEVNRLRACPRATGASSPPTQVHGSINGNFVKPTAGSESQTPLRAPGGALARRSSRNRATNIPRWA